MNRDDRWGATSRRLLIAALMGLSGCAASPSEEQGQRNRSGRLEVAYREDGFVVAAVRPYRQLTARREPVEIKLYEALLNRAAQANGNEGNPVRVADGVYASPSVVGALNRGAPRTGDGSTAESAGGVISQLPAAVVASTCERGLSHPTTRTPTLQYTACFAVDNAVLTQDDYREVAKFARAGSEFNIRAHAFGNHVGHESLSRRRGEVVRDVLTTNGAAPETIQLSAHYGDDCLVNCQQDVQVTTIPYK